MIQLINVWHQLQAWKLFKILVLVTISALTVLQIKHTFWETITFVVCVWMWQKRLFPDWLWCRFSQLTQPWAAVRAFYEADEVEQVPPSVLHRSWRHTPTPRSTQWDGNQHKSCLSSASQCRTINTFPLLHRAKAQWRLNSDTAVMIRSTSHESGRDDTDSTQWGSVIDSYGANRQPSV